LVFIDVAEGEWYNEASSSVAARSIVKGAGDNEFALE
jgi:hypothetical protein